jgi:hypothetical protein
LESNEERIIKISDRILPGVFQVLNLLEPVRVLGLEQDVILADDSHWCRCLCLSGDVDGAASVVADVMHGHVLDGQSDVAEIEESGDPGAYIQ